MSNFELSKYQKDIIDWVNTGTGHAFVEAVAGSGKTTTLVEIAKRCNIPDGVMVAFNSHIAKELNEKLRSTNIEAKTVHSIGFGGLRRYLPSATLDKTKYNDIVLDRYTDLKAELDWQDWSDFYNTTKKLCNFARLSLATCPDDVKLIREDHQIWGGASNEDILSLINTGDTVARETGMIDFTDMIYLPVRWDLDLRKYLWIFVDEAQDISNLQFEVVKRLCYPKSRIIFVGDRRQAIYGFAGANAESYEYIREETGATDLPLSICYRCGKDIVEFAQMYVPQIEPFEKNSDGTVEYIEEKNIEKIADNETLILCRFNAPNISMCLSLVASGKRAYIRGRDIGSKLKKIFKGIEESESSFDFIRLGTYIDRWHRNEMRKLMDRDAPESTMDYYNDLAECLRVFAEMPGANSMNNIYDKIDALFSDNEYDAIVLSTIHKAKGLEANKVIVLGFDKLPFTKREMPDWQFEQEKNLVYVAITRAKNQLLLAMPADPNSSDTSYLSVPITEPAVNGADPFGEPVERSDELYDRISSFIDTLREVNPWLAEEASELFTQLTSNINE